MSETPPETTPGLLASPTDLALRLRVAASDPALLLALRRASSRFEGAIGYPVALVVDDEVTLSGDGTRRLLLPARPVVGTPTVVVDGTVLVHGVDFRVGRDAGILRRAAGCVWPDELDVVEVTYTHGWTVIPGDVEDAVLEQAEAVYDVEVALQSRSSGAESVTYSASAAVGVTQRWTDTVERYRLARDDA